MKVALTCEKSVDAEHFRAILHKLHFSARLLGLPPIAHVFWTAQPIARISMHLAQLHNPSALHGWEGLRGAPEYPRP